jgi:hypothetical protein
MTGVSVEGRTSPRRSAGVLRLDAARRPGDGGRVSQGSDPGPHRRDVRGRGLRPRAVSVGWPAAKVADQMPIGRHGPGGAR